MLQQGFKVCKGKRAVMWISTKPLSPLQHRPQNSPSTTSTASLSDTELLIMTCHQHTEGLQTQTQSEKMFDVENTSDHLNTSGYQAL